MNLLAPLEFDEQTISQFIRDNVCGLCRGYLLKGHSEGRKYHAFCPNHGPIMDHNHVSNYQAEKAEQNERAGIREINKMKPRPKKSAAQIISELGL